MSSRAAFIQLLEEIAEREELCISFAADKWVVKLQSLSGRSTFIYGYNFDINGSASQQICSDKPATSACLALAGVPAIPHEAFLNPSDPFVSSYVPITGALSAIHAYAEAHNFPVVVKPLKGTAGNLVFRAANPRELEAAVLKVWQTDYGVAVSPFVEILDEIRVVVSLGDAQLVYRKRRPCIVGDGVGTALELLSEALSRSSHPKRLCDSIGSMSAKFLNSVPEDGESVVTEWRHNLGLGAEAERVECPSAVAIALSAAEALNMKFCSVDIVVLADERMAVLEINSGVMMDAFMQSSAENREVALQIYARAVRYSLGL